MNVLNFIKDDMKIRVREVEGGIELNLRDIAIGLGMTQSKNDKLYFRFERINRYLQDVRYSSPSLGKEEELETTWILEQYFYKLSMKADKGESIKFQDWLAFEVIPNIRKNGGYISEEATSEQLDELRNRIDILQGTVDNFDNSTLNNNRLSRKLKDFLEHMFDGKVENPYQQFLDTMKNSGTLDSNYLPTNKFIELNEKNGKIFRYKTEICIKREEWFTVTNVGMSYLSKTLREKEGKIISIKHLTELE